jgi:hypothetical protein
MEIRRIGALSAAKVLGVLYALIGLIAGLFVALGALLGALGDGGFRLRRIGPSDRIRDRGRRRGDNRAAALLRGRGGDQRPYSSGALQRGGSLGGRDKDRNPVELTPENPVSRHFGE